MIRVHQGFWKKFRKSDWRLGPSNKDEVIDRIYIHGILASNR